MGSLLGWSSLKIMAVGAEVPLVRVARGLVGEGRLPVGGEERSGISWTLGVRSTWSMSLWTDVMVVVVMVVVRGSGGGGFWWGVLHG